MQFLLQLRLFERCQIWILKKYNKKVSMLEHYSQEDNRMKILIIDDSSVMRRMHKNVFIEHKFKEEDLIEADDGVKAFQIAKDQVIDLFLVDWNMPYLNGYEFVKKIRAIEKYQKTPIIMITSEAAKYNVVEAIKIGVTNYIVKPIKADMLWQKLEKYLEEKS